MFAWIASQFSRIIKRRTPWIPHRGQLTPKNPQTLVFPWQGHFVLICFQINVREASVLSDDRYDLAQQRDRWLWWDWRDLFVHPFQLPLYWTMSDLSTHWMPWVWGPVDPLQAPLATTSWLSWSRAMARNIGTFPVFSQNVDTYGCRMVFMAHNWRCCQLWWGFLVLRIVGTSTPLWQNGCMPKQLKSNLFLDA